MNIFPRLLLSVALFVPALNLYVRLCRLLFPSSCSNRFKHFEILLSGKTPKSRKILPEAP